MPTDISNRRPPFASQWHPHVESWLAILICRTWLLPILKKTMSKTYVNRSFGISGLLHRDISPSNHRLQHQLNALYRSFHWVSMVILGLCKQIKFNQVQQLKMVKYWILSELAIFRVSYWTWMRSSGNFQDSCSWRPVILPAVDYLLILTSNIFSSFTICSLIKCDDGRWSKAYWLIFTEMNILRILSFECMIVDGHYGDSKILR